MAYRAKRREGASHQKAHEADIAAMQEMWPLSREKECLETLMVDVDG